MQKGPGGTCVSPGFSFEIRVMIELIVKLRYRDIYNFLIYKNYRSSQGITPIILAVLVVLVAALSFGKIPLHFTVIYFICAGIFLVYQPILLYFQARAQIRKNLVLSNPILYTLSEAGIKAVSGAVIEDNVIEMAWDEILMVRETKQELFIFRDKENAFVLPKDATAGSLRKVRKLIRDMMHHGDVSLLK